jgi:hypothetical protein
LENGAIWPERPGNQRKTCGIAPANGRSEPFADIDLELALLWADAAE